MGDNYRRRLRRRGVLCHRCALSLYLGGTVSRAVTGLTVRERNYLDVFPYDKWSNKILPNFEEDEEFMPSVCELKEGQTTRPSLLTEADLVSLMDKNGIGNLLRLKIVFLAK